MDGISVYNLFTSYWA